MAAKSGMTKAHCTETVQKLAQFHVCTKTKVSTLTAEECGVFVPWPWDPVSDGEMQAFADALQGMSILIISFADHNVEHRIKAYMYN